MTASSANPNRTKPMRVITIFILLTSFIALGGCAAYRGVDEKYAREQQMKHAFEQQQYIANLKNQCAQYGAREGTSEMVQCILQLQQNEASAEANRQQVEANAAEARRRGWQNASRILNESTKITPISPPIDNSMNCRSYQNGNEIITNCR